MRDDEQWTLPQRATMCIGTRMTGLALSRQFVVSYATIQTAWVDLAGRHVEGMFTGIDRGFS